MRSVQKLLIEVTEFTRHSTEGREELRHKIQNQTLPMHHSRSQNLRKIQKGLRTEKLRDQQAHRASNVTGQVRLCTSRSHSSMRLDRMDELSLPTNCTSKSPNQIVLLLYLPIYPIDYFLHIPYEDQSAQRVCLGPVLPLE